MCAASRRAETGPDLRESRRNKSSGPRTLLQSGLAVLSRFYGYRISERNTRLRFYPATTAGRLHTHMATTRSNNGVIASSRSPYQRQCEEEVSEIATIMAEVEKGAITIFDIVALCRIFSSCQVFDSLFTTHSRRLTVF